MLIVCCVVPAIYYVQADLLSLMALCGTAKGATGLSLSTSLIREQRTGSLCLSLYLGYRPSNTVHSSSYTNSCTCRLHEKGCIKNKNMYFVLTFFCFLVKIPSASGLCRRKATIQFSQAAVVSVPPIRRSTVAMWTWISVNSWEHEDM